MVALPSVRILCTLLSRQGKRKLVDYKYQVLYVSTCILNMFVWLFDVKKEVNDTVHEFSYKLHVLSNFESPLNACGSLVMIYGFPIKHVIC